MDGNGASPHTDYLENSADAKSGNASLHFFSDDRVDFKAEQTITGLKRGTYQLSAFLQGGNAEGAELYLFAKTSGQEYRAAAAVNGWGNWKNPEISEILVKDGAVTIGVSVTAGPGAWGSIDDFVLYQKAR
ncbi:hypothetical protein [Bacillus sp. NSP9.1]|uniref:hypothetical protein n=1 Tax=Bacillus sp. NSP9.1 TaxID=1071078 RepID=UPI0003F702E0|nr:hypothetical protein [Bacillus sp. NSP9.1]QHZ44978.1 hypothetical protein M654_001040 [Bacillus sp. NSP9.1]